MKTDCFDLSALRLPSWPLAALAAIALALAGPTGCADPQESGAGGAGDAMEQAEEGMGEEGGMEGGAMGEADMGEEGMEGEHAEGGEESGHDEGGGEGEESGRYVARDAEWDQTRRMIRLRLSFDEESGSFTGTVDNGLDVRVCSVRVEVHLADGTELGPTDAMDLDAGASMPVELDAGGADFEMWTAHPEVSRCPAQ